MVLAPVKGALAVSAWYVWLARARGAEASVAVANRAIVCFVAFELAEGARLGFVIACVY